MKFLSLSIFISLIFFVGSIQQVNATEYYVDSYLGDDSNEGISSEKPWRSIALVNAAKLGPGDVVRFRRGRVWRETLRPQSGTPEAPITYSAYGEGTKPRIMRSVDLSDPKYWTRIEGTSIWTTPESRWEEKETNSPIAEKFACGKWHIYTEDGASVHFEERTFDELNGIQGYSIECAEPGTSDSLIQFTNNSFSTRDGEFVSFRFKARSTQEFLLGNAARVFQVGPPWTSYAKTVDSPRSIGEQWRDYEVVFELDADADDARITFFLGSILPKDSRLDIVPIGACSVDALGPSLLNSDVGNVVLTKKESTYKPTDEPALKSFVPTWDKGELAGFKRWAFEELKEQDDFWYDEKSRRVFFYSDENPGERYASIEAVLREHACSCSASDVIIENIAFTHSGAHGIASGRNARLTVRDCDFDWIGGGDLSGAGGTGRRVRFGNGVEFWEGSVDCLIERCRFSRVYDVALTTQGREPVVSRNLIMRDNVIYRCEQAFEIWFSNTEAVLEGCVFERNLCVDSGRDWSHIQRPDKAATAILGYGLVAKTVDVTIRDNVFDDSAMYFVRCSHNRFDEYHFSNNVYWMRPDREHYVGDKYFVFNLSGGNEGWTYDEFKALGKDVDSRWIEPTFRDYEKDDLELTNRDVLGAGPLPVTL